MRRHLELQPLEDRRTPAGNVTGTLVGFTWFITGDADSNELLINPTATPGTFTLTGLNGTTVTGIDDPTNVASIVVNLFAGDDNLTINDTTAFGPLVGNLTIKGGDGANFVAINDFAVDGNLTIINGVNTTLTDRLDMVDTSVGGKLTINNGPGDTETYIFPADDTYAYIGGSLSINNGRGRDFIDIVDINIGGNVAINNGTPDANSEAGYVWFYNNNNAATQSLLRGNLAVNFLGGQLTSGSGLGLWDYEITGNASINLGTGGGELFVDGFVVDEPTRVHGNFSIAAKDTTTLLVGFQGYQDKGLVVGKNFSVTTGSGADQLFIAGLRVQGATKMNLGAGADYAQFEDSVFQTFQLLTGAGDDQVFIEADTNYTKPTQFLKAVKIDLGANNDYLALGLANDDNARVELFANTLLLGGSGTDTIDELNRNIMLPLFLTVTA